MKDETFCPLPWLHLSMESSSLEYKTCCVSHHLIGAGKPLTLLTSTPEEAIQHPTMNKIRQNMLEGRKSQECSVCYKEESENVTSMREFYANMYKSSEEKLKKSTDEKGNFIQKPKIENLELRLGNLCNLKCVMCSPYNSSSFDDYTEIFNKSYVPINPDQDLLTEDVLASLKGPLNDLRYLTFRGGEPLINPSHLKVLNFLVENKLAQNIDLHYTTNGTTLPPKLKDLWKHFNTVTVWVSVEATGDVNEFIRFPSHWKTLENNLFQLDEWAGQIPKLGWGIVTTVQVYNLPVLNELFQFLKKFSYGYKVPFINYLNDPEIFDLKMLPLHVLQDTHKTLSEELKSVNLNSQLLGKERKMLIFKDTVQRNQANYIRFENFLTYLSGLKGGHQHERNKLIDLTYRIAKTRNIEVPEKIRKFLETI